MDFILLKNFIASYSLPTLIIAFSVCVVTILLNKFLSEKISKTLFRYLPFLLAILVNFVYDMIVIKQFCFREHAFYLGVLSGSLSLVFYGAFNKLKKGQFVGLTPTVLLIEELLIDLVDKDKITKTALSLENLIAQNNEDEQSLIAKIIDVLKLNSSCVLGYDELLKIAYLIIKAVKSL